MNVSLPDTWEQFVASQVRAGEFGNASEVVREALRLLRNQQESHAQHRHVVDDRTPLGETERLDTALALEMIRSAEAEGKLADVLVVRQQHEDPWESLVAARVQDIELLVQDGSPILGDAAHEELFTGRGVQYSKVSVRGRRMIVKGDPEGLMERVRKAVGFRKVLDFIPLDA